MIDMVDGTHISDRRSIQLFKVVLFAVDVEHLLVDQVQAAAAGAADGAPHQFLHGLFAFGVVQAGLRSSNILQLPRTFQRLMQLVFGSHLDMVFEPLQLFV
jgi:hypothetical protein